MWTAALVFFAAAMLLGLVAGFYELVGIAFGLAVLCAEQLFR